LNQRTETTPAGPSDLVQGNDGFRFGPLEVLLDRRTVLTDGRTLPLTVREFHLLASLATRAEEVVSRGDLYEMVWGSEMRERDRSVDVYVSKVRTKLQVALPHWSYIHTHIGFGYCFSPRHLVG
jgi:DNA-binding response OmpR family regulator